jgi:hypothetical protein
MGLPPEERNFFRTTFGAAFTFTLKGDPTVAIVDFMQYVKSIGKDVATKDQMLTYFINNIQFLMMDKTSTFRTVIVMVDGIPPPVKRMIEHKKRYAKKDVFDAKKGPYLPKRGCDLIPAQDQWIRFAGNYKLLRRELYPELFNAFMRCTHFTPPVGKTLILSGFPGRSAWENLSGPGSWDNPAHSQGRVRVVRFWEPSELPITSAMEKMDPDLYHRCYVLVNEAPCPEFPRGALRRQEWDQGKCTIGEADLRMFWFEHWFQKQDICFFLNDGDIFSIGLLYAYERIENVDQNGKYKFRNNHTACLPYKKTSDNEFFAEGEVPRSEYVNLDTFYQSVADYEPLKSAGVQNHALTMVFLVVMAGSDFFKDFLKGMGSQNVIWRVFFDNIHAFTHMVQLSTGVAGSTRTKRTLILDEDLFRQFIYMCFLQQYEGAELKKRKVDKLTLKELRERTQTDAKGKPKEDAEYHLPDRNKIRLWCRQVEWNLDYWKNGVFGFLPDPFQMWRGIPYYPYWRDPKDKNRPKFINVVAAEPKPVDLVYEQHLYRTRVLNKKRARESKEDVADRQQRVIDRYEHKVKD